MRCHFGSFYREAHLIPTAILNLMMNALSMAILKLSNFDCYGRYSRHIDVPLPPTTLLYDYKSVLVGSHRHTLHLYSVSLYFGSSSKETPGRQGPSLNSTANLQAAPQCIFG